MNRDVTDLTAVVLGQPGRKLGILVGLGDHLHKKAGHDWLVTGDDVPAVNFPFKVSNNHPEVLLIEPTGAARFCEWRLAIDWTSGGRTGTTVVDRGFGPIISDPNHDGWPLIYFENGD
jgi:hypothetical protein